MILQHETDKSSVKCHVEGHGGNELALIAMFMVGPQTLDIIAYPSKVLAELTYCRAMQQPRQWGFNAEHERYQYSCPIGSLLYLGRITNHYPVR